MTLFLHNLCRGVGDTVSLCSHSMGAGREHGDPMYQWPVCGGRGTTQHKCISTAIIFVI